MRPEADQRREDVDALVLNPGNRAFRLRHEASDDACCELEGTMSIIRR